MFAHVNSRPSGRYSTGSGRITESSFGNAGAVHKDDLPVARPFFEEGRFQPILLRGTGGVGDAASLIRLARDCVCLDFALCPVDGSQPLLFVVGNLIGDVRGPRS
jgi:hypothetical protein